MLRARLPVPNDGFPPAVYTLDTFSVCGPLWTFCLDPARRLMQNRNPQFDPQDQENATNPPGVSVPVKGDSASSNPPSDPGATRVDVPNSVLDPYATQVDADATLIDAVPAPRSTGPGTSRVQSGVGPTLQPGDVLGGRYEILQLLGEGGMGAVYKAM